MCYPISYLNFKAVLALSRHIKVQVSFELFGTLYMYISGVFKKTSDTNLWHSSLWCCYATVFVFEKLNTLEQNQRPDMTEPI